MHPDRPPRTRRRFRWVAAAAVCLSGCGWSLLPGPSIDGRDSATKWHDFEAARPGSLPDGFSAAAGTWRVANNPEAASGEHVVASAAEDEGRLAVPGTPDRPYEVTVSVRVPVGDAGGGIGCIADAGAGVRFMVEPSEQRVALYRESGDGSLALVAERPIPDDEIRRWHRIGLRCGDASARAYLGRRRIGSVATTQATRLVLLTSAGSVALFDDLGWLAAR